VVDLTPASQQPYVGSTQDNSEVNLALNYNKIDRLLGVFGRRRSPFSNASLSSQSFDATTSARNPQGPGTVATPGHLIQPADPPFANRDFGGGLFGAGD